MTEIIDDLRKIEIATKKSKYTDYIFISVFVGILIFLWLATLELGKKTLFDFKGINFYGNLFGMAFATAFICWAIYYLVSTQHLPKVIYPTKEGIKVNPKRIYVQKVSRDFIIKYDWIELVVMNEMYHGDLVIEIFFTVNGKKYLYRDKQGRIKNIEDFIRTLRDKGIEVKVLEPSYKYQKKHDFGWIADMMRGREFV